jgi:hypothetical protein
MSLFLRKNPRNEKKKKRNNFDRTMDNRTIFQNLAGVVFAGEKREVPRG